MLRSVLRRCGLRAPLVCGPIASGSRNYPDALPSPPYRTHRQSSTSPEPPPASPSATGARPRRSHEPGPGHGAAGGRGGGGGGGETRGRSRHEALRVPEQGDLRSGWGCQVTRNRGRSGGTPRRARVRTQWSRVVPAGMKSLDPTPQREWHRPSRPSAVWGWPGSSFAALKPWTWT